MDDKSRLNFPELEKCSQNVLKIGSNRTIQLESVVMRHRSQIATHAITLPLSVPIQATPSRRTNYKTAHTIRRRMFTIFRRTVASQWKSANLIDDEASIEEIFRHDKYRRWSVSIRVKRSSICQCAGHNIRVNGLKCSIAIAMRVINVCNVREGYRYRLCCYCPIMKKDI